MTFFSGWFGRGKRKARPASDPRRGDRKQRLGLFLEQLEGRDLMAAITWTNPAGGSWDEASNWNLNRTPTGGDAVVIPDLPGSPTINYSTGPTTIDSLTSAE